MIQDHINEVLKERNRYGEQISEMLAAKNREILKLVEEYGNCRAAAQSAYEQELSSNAFEKASLVLVRIEEMLNG